MELRFIKRYLFGREVGATIRVSPETAWGIKAQSGKHEIRSITGTVVGPGYPVRTGRRWELSRERVPGKFADIKLSEEGLPRFLEAIRGSPADLYLTARDLGILSEEEVIRKIAFRLGDPGWHTGSNPAHAPIEERVRRLVKLETEEEEEV